MIFAVFFHAVSHFINNYSVCYRSTTTNRHDVQNRDIDHKRWKKALGEYVFKDIHRTNANGKYNDSAIHKK